MDTSVIRCKNSCEKSALNYTECAFAVYFKTVKCVFKKTVLADNIYEIKSQLP